MVEPRRSLTLSVSVKSVLAGLMIIVVAAFAFLSAYMLTPRVADPSCEAALRVLKRFDPASVGGLQLKWYGAMESFAANMRRCEH